VFPGIRAAPSRRLSGEIATLVPPKEDNGPDGDWQTVSTDQALAAPRGFNDILGRATGSSLADITDTSGCEFCLGDNSSTDRILQHPQQPGQYQSDHSLGDKRTSRLMLGVRAHRPSALAHNSRQHDPRLPSRAAAAIRRFSNTFRRDHLANQSSSAQRNVELETLGHSYDSLSSDDEAKPGSGPLFLLSTNQQAPGRTDFRHQSYPSGVSESPMTPSSPHMRCDETPDGILRLPFPLISLPEAAMLQRIRRARGEEDHTISGGSFTSKTRSGTASTASSSQFPRTPLSTYFDCQTWSSYPSPLIATESAHHAHHLNGYGRKTTGKLRAS
jgi:hypothetical protein